MDLPAPASPSAPVMTEGPEHPVCSRVTPTIPDAAPSTDRPTAVMAGPDAGIHPTTVRPGAGAG
jgi:hypothetical protein